ncbi:MAG: metal-sensitive transcriptional regulator [Pseudobdellovibrio sp.]
MSTNGKRRKNNSKITTSTVTAHDHSSELKRLSRIKGQVSGIERMILEKRYCPEIVIQIKAARSALKSLEANILEGHLYHCVNVAIKSRDPKVIQEKLEEIVSLLKGG